MSDPDRPKIWSYLPPDVYNYFFRKIYAGDRGIKQQLVVQFFEALYTECLRHGIKAEWDIESAKRIQRIMSKINFQHESHRSRCTAHSPSKPAKESPPRHDDGRATDGVSD